MTGNGNAKMQFCGSIESIGFLNEDVDVMI